MDGIGLIRENDHGNFGDVVKAPVQLGQNVLWTQGRASAYNELGRVREAEWYSLALSSLPEAGAV